MWFGDLVTMRWWDDLWLNESFATWASALAAGRGHPVAQRLDHVRQAAEGLGLPAGPAALHAPDRRRHPRHRGGRGQLRRHHLRQGRRRCSSSWSPTSGRDNFLAGVRRYFGQHAWGNATLADLLARAGGGLRPGPGRLVEGVAGDRRGEHAAAGVRAGRRRPVHRVRGAAGGAAEPPGAPPAPDRDRPVRPDRGRADPAAPGGDRHRRRAHRAARAGRGAPARPGAGQRRRPDLRQDPAGRALAGHADQPASASSPSRCPPRCAGPPPGTCAGTPRWPPGDYVSLVIAGAPTRSSDIAVLQTAAPAGRRGGCAGSPTRPGGPRARQLHGRRRCAAWPSRPSPARTASWPTLQAFAGVATAPGDLALLAGLLDGSAHLDGLEVDTELRWRLLHRLVSRGAAGPAEIDAELDRDPTDAGERRAATCRAAIPDAAAKEAAWAGDHQRHAAERHVPGHAQRVPGPGPPGAAGAVRGAVLRRRSATSGATGAATWRSTSPATPTR